MSQKIEKKSSKASSKKGAKKGKPSQKNRSSGLMLPGYLQAMLSAAQLIVLIAGTAVGVNSYLSGASLPILALRTGAALLSTGLILWLVCWLVIRRSISAIYEFKQAAVQQAAQQSANTVEA